MIGGGVGTNWNESLLVARPTGVTTEISPEQSFSGTNAVTVVREFAMNLASLSLNRTLSVLPKLSPLIVIVSPICALAGVKLRITGTPLPVSQMQALPGL